MSPMNDAAIKVKEMIGSLLIYSQVERIKWTDDLAAVLCNWEVLHGRGHSPQDENSRILERVYVE